VGSGQYLWLRRPCQASSASDVIQAVICEDGRRRTNLGVEGVTSPCPNGTTDFDDVHEISAKAIRQADRDWIKPEIGEEQAFKATSLPEEYRAKQVQRTVVDGWLAIARQSGIRQINGQQSII